MFTQCLVSSCERTWTFRSLARRGKARIPPRHLARCFAMLSMTQTRKNQWMGKLLYSATLRENINISVYINYLHSTIGEIYNAFSLFRLSGKTHYKSIRYCYLFLSDNQFFVSRRSHKSHRWRFASPALVGLAECFQPDGKRECNDAFFVRFLRSAWKSNICESVVYWNINYKDSVCYSFIMRFPSSYRAKLFTAAQR